jgi:glutamate synthase domain-containing protein 1/glutamate synthase domain-containing protein 3
VPSPDPGALLGARARWLARRALPPAAAGGEEAAEGGCGVIGLAASVPVAGRHLLSALAQMANRGNGKGGGIAAVGLDPADFGVARATLENDYLLAIALLDPAARAALERDHLAPVYEIHHALRLPSLPDCRALPRLEIEPPEVRIYFVRARPDALARFLAEEQLDPRAADRAEDELVWRTSFALDAACYAATGEKRAFVLSHAKNLLVLKAVGYADDVVRYYRLEDLRARVWIGHHRYPTKGRVWHPGGAHPFVGLHEALVHNGDFANYASIASYLAERGIRPLFLTDTEVAVQVFDLLHRVYGYPLEYVIEALAPTTERDFTRLPPEKRKIYRALQAIHIHASPDGPWFFLVARSDAARRAALLLGITDTSMLRPQVFALQRSERAAIGCAASEKQAIDAALESLAAEDARFWGRADRYWNARGGSHTDGGAFLFESIEGAPLIATDKFGRAIDVDPRKRAPGSPWRPAAPAPPESTPRALLAAAAIPLFEAVAAALPAWGYEEAEELLAALPARAAGESERRALFALLAQLLDRPFPTGALKPSAVRVLVDRALARLAEEIRDRPATGFVHASADRPLPSALAASETAVLDARGFPPEGPRSAARALVELVARGFRRIAVVHCRGHRFLGCGLGRESTGVAIDVFGSSGDYLASGIDGASVTVHGSAQDQVGQIVKAGTLVVHGDVGQTFLYGAKGGDVYVLGNAAGRPLINAVGRPRVVINGTCLDYLAESFMAGDPLNGGGFALVNGIGFDEDGAIVELPTPYPGGNLFSLASGGAIYVRDPRRLLGEDQLNGGAFAALGDADWELIRPHLEENERLFGVPVAHLLEVDGEPRPPAEVYRKIAPSGHEALLPEEAWVRRAG